MSGVKGERLDLTADAIVARLHAMRSDVERRKMLRYVTPGTDPERYLGVRMGEIFALAKAHIDLPLGEIERLLDSPIHEARVAALSVMDKQARRKRTPPEHRRALFDLYLRRLDRIDTWDLVDLAAPWAIGGYLLDHPDDMGVLDDLARSENPMARRSAMYATATLLRSGDLDPAFHIAELLVNDPHELVQKAVGGWLRGAGQRDPARLEAFLERHAATMPRVALRQAIEHLDADARKAWLTRVTS